MSEVNKTEWTMVQCDIVPLSFQNFLKTHIKGWPITHIVKMIFLLDMIAQDIKNECAKEQSLN